MSKLEKDKVLIWRIIKEFRFDQCEKFDLNWDYDEFYHSTIEELFKPD